MKLVFAPAASDDYEWWQLQDKRVVKHINLLIRDILRNPAEGIGKPEMLKHRLSGFWARRINDEHRLVYRLLADEIQIVSCRYHYGK